jgi:serine protease
VRLWGRSLAAVAGGALLVGLVAPVASAAPDDGYTPIPRAGTAKALGTAKAREARPITRLIVKTSNGKPLSSSGLTAAGRLAGSPATPQAKALSRGQSLVYLGTALSTADAWKAAKQLAARADVVWAEPDLPVYTSDASPVTPNDPSFGQQWDVWDAAGTNGNYSTRVPRIWDRTKGDPSIVVAVIDTGLTVHPDLTASVVAPTASDPIVKGYDFVSADPGGVFYSANDGNGRDADPSDPGDWITAADSAGSTLNGFFLNCPVEPSSWHGTHVTGTIVAKQGNGIGVTGMAPGVKVQPVRALGRCGGYTSDINDAILWASGDVVSGAPANATPASVINMSLGGPGACLQSTQDAINIARSHGTTVVVAAGNSAENLDTGSQPADCTGVVRVTASTKPGGIATYSNSGDPSFPATVAAPGGDGISNGFNILSTLNSGATVPSTPTYAKYAGTSMATPHVAAAAALLQSTRAGRTPYTPDEVSSWLQAHAQPFAPGATAVVNNTPVSCTAALCGAGIIDLSTLPSEAPLAPSVTVAQGDGQLTATWTAADPGGLAVTYDVKTSTSGSGPWGAPQVLDTGATTATLSGLTNGTAYWVQVTAKNSQGSAAPVVVGPFTPSSYAVGSPAATGGVEHIATSWTAPTAPAATVTGYGLRYRIVGTTDWLSATADAAATSAELTTWPTPLPAGTYEVQIAALHDALAVDSPGLEWSSSITTTVAALVNGISSSATILRPFRDGFQDSVTIRVSTNRPGGASGSLRILNSVGTIVKIVPLATGSYWRIVWTGLNQKNVRVPNGRYYFQAYLPNQAGTLTPLTRPTILVASSQAARPTIAMTSTALYPVRDGYRDFTTITATAGVPAVFTMKVVQVGKVKYQASFTRRTLAKLVYGGAKIGGGILPSGTYFLYVYAKGGEGTLVSSYRKFTVSTKRAVKTTFAITYKAYPACKTAFYNGEQPAYDSVSGIERLPSQSLLTCYATLPSSVLPHASVRVRVATYFTDGVPVRRFGYYGGSPTSPNLIAPVGVSSSSYLTPLAPSVSYLGGKLRWYVFNDAVDPSYWYVSTYTLTGYRWVLV